MLEKHLKDLLSTVVVNIINFTCQKILLTQTNINHKLVNLNFKIKVPENITSHIISNTSVKQQQLEITGKFLPTDGRYKEVIIKLIITKHNFLVSSLQKRQKLQDIFLLHQAKIFIHYTNLRNKIWHNILILHKLDFQQNQR